VTASGADGSVRPPLRRGAVRSSRIARCACVAAALLVAGCGGGGEQDGGSAAIESKADYIAAGDKICRDRDERSIELVENAAGKTTPVLTGELAAIYADVNARLLALELPPGADRAGAQRFATAVSGLRKPVARMKASADELAADIEAKRPTKAGLEELTANVNTVQAISDLADQRAREYGFKSCGQQQTTVPIA